LRCFSVDLKDNSTVQMLDGHESYINDCVFNPLQGDAIASVSGRYLHFIQRFQVLNSINVTTGGNLT
jgi:hypothetical protein